MCKRGPVGRAQRWGRILFCELIGRVSRRTGLGWLAESLSRAGSVGDFLNERERACAML